MVVKSTYKNKRNPGFSFSFPSIFAFLVIACILFLPNMASAVQVTLAWDANSEPELAGYRAFLRQEGQNYNFDNPAWEGTETTCTIFDLDENISYYFVVRAYNTSGLESGNSNEVVYQSDYSAPPTANAGPDQTVYEEDTVILNGSNSSDPDDDIAFYHWNQVTGTQVVLSDTEAVRPTFIAPDVDGPGGQFLTFQLAVTDETGLTSTDTCIVVVNNEEEPNTDPDIDPDIVIDTDEDGIPDQDEVDLYGTNPSQADTDGDGINDGEELDYWVDRWDADDDGDGLINLLDDDSDNDGLTDGLEIAQGYDPSDPSSKPSSGSERVTAGQLVLYAFEEGSGTRVYDVSGFGTPLDLIVDDETAISWITGGGLEIKSSTVIQSAGAARKVIDAVKASDELSIEAWITPANTTQRGPARIVTLSRDSSYRNFTLGQYLDAYDVRLRTTETSYNGIPSLRTSYGSLASQLTHVVYTRDVFGAINLYMDGALVVSGTAGGDCSVWDDYTLVLANELTGDRPWLGTYHMVAIFDRALDQAGVLQNFAAGPGVAADVPPEEEPNTDPDIVIDTDEDGIPDQDEIDLYGTNPNQGDTDGDGINDGAELDYWVDRWDADDDSDGLINLLDEDSDNDGFSDGLEIAQGYDPSDPSSKPSSGGEVTTVEVRVAASSDDAEERASGSMSLTSPDLELVYDDYIDAGNQKVGIRFTGVDIPEGATIVNAYVQFQVDETSSVATSLTIVGEDIDDAETFTSTSRDISSRVKTTANVPWSPVAWNTVGQAGPDQRTPDVSQIIEEIVGRPGWSSGNSLAVIITGTGERVAESYNGDRGGAPLLYVEYTTDVPPEEEPNTDPDIVIDTDEDGIPDQDEIDLYGTNPNQGDTDGDGINDGAELDYWVDRWDADDDSDGLINLLDEDSDNDGFSDGLEIAQGYDPSDPSSKPSSGSERVTAGQLVLYAFEEGSGTRVYDVSGFGTPLDLIVDNETAISWIAGGGLEIKSSTVIQSAGAARKVIDAVKASDELSIEAWITPANTTQGGPARIVTLSRDSSYRNFTLGQHLDAYDVRLRTTETSYNGIPSLRTSYGSLTNQLTHVVYTRDVFGATKLYMDGALVVSGSEGGDCSVWDNYYALTLANELTGDRPWLGTYHMVAIFERALDQAGVLQNFAAGPSLN
jgi:hypothetical protein